MERNSSYLRTAIVYQLDLGINVRNCQSATPVVRRLNRQSCNSNEQMLFRNIHPAERMEAYPHDKRLIVCSIEIRLTYRTVLGCRQWHTFR